MKRTAGVFAALWLASAACGGTEDNAPEQTSPAATSILDGSAAASPGVLDASAGASDAGTSLPSEASAANAPEAAVPPGTTPVQDAATTAPPAKDAAAPRPPLVLQIPTATMPCGGSSCDTLTNVCCESWSQASGFGSAQACMTNDDCNNKYSRSGDSNRAIGHECDGKEDCSGGQVCCLYAPGQPLCALEDIADCITKLTGPGGAGICADNDKCKLGSMQFIAAGVPLGVLACNDNSDCQDRPGTSCQSEQDDSITTGKGVKARSYVKVCR